jgi:hypothetical protein
VHREHQQAMRALAQRMLRDHIADLHDDVRVAAAGKLSLQPTLLGEEPELVEPRRSRAEKRSIVEVGERRPAPERERIGEGRCRLLNPSVGERLRSRVREALETVEVERFRVNADYVAGAPRLDRVSTQRFSELRDVTLNEIRRGCRRIVRPELVNDSSCGNHRVRLPEQTNEYAALKSAAEM